MSFSDEQAKILRQNGYRPTEDTDKWKNQSNGHTATNRTGTTIFDTDRHTKNGRGISNSDFGKKAW